MEPSTQPGPPTDADPRTKVEMEIGTDGLDPAVDAVVDATVDPSDLSSDTTLDSASDGTLDPATEAIPDPTTDRATDPTPDLEIFVARRLKEAAEEIATEWVEALAGALAVHPSRLLPTDELRDHVPAVLKSLADYLAVPVEPVKGDVVDRLQLLTQLRREQGYDIQELVIEFETLTRQLTHRFRRIVGSYPGEADPVRVAEISERLHEALAVMTRVTVGTYHQEASEQRRELSSRLADYTRALSHELRNPLNAASGAAQLLRSGDLPDAKRERFLDLIVQSLDRVDDLIADIGTLAVEERARSETRWISLREAVQFVFEEVREHAVRKDVALEVEGELPDIKVDAARVQIALMNLVANAIKYSDPAEDERWVRVGASQADPDGRTEDGWTIRVRDNGLGIPRALQNKVFQRHFRAHPEVAEGTGLGLSITHHLVTQRGGSIRFESTEGEGSTFYVTIPPRPQRPERRDGRRHP